MLKKLKQHWEVSTNELILILCTFAVTGTLTAWLSKKVTEWLSIDQYGFAWWSAKIIILIFGYQVIILIIGFCFGMFPFFWRYEKKILSRFGLMKKQTPAINDAKENNKFSVAIFASGAGSNAQKIIDHFRNNQKIRVALIVCNNPKAGVLTIAAKESIPLLLLEKNNFMQTGCVSELESEGIDLIVLAGFLWKIPEILIRAFTNRIINLHPALLPAYGGKGMYGAAVHNAVINAHEKESGITIHYVDEHYDHGKIIFQARCPVQKNETPETLASKIHQLEHTYYPETIENIINNHFE